MKALIDKFVNSLICDKKVSSNTVAAYKGDLNGLLLFLNNHGYEDIGTVNFTMLNSYVLNMEKDKMSCASISRRISVIKSFFEYLFYNGYIKTNPAYNLKPPKVVKKAPDIIEEEDMVKFLASIDISDSVGMRDRAMFELMYYTGIRVVEIISLKISDIDITMGSVTVINERKGRSIPLESDAVKILDKYIKEDRQRLNPVCDKLFVNRLGQGLTRQGIAVILDTYRQNFKYKELLSPGVFRKSYAVRMIEKGTDLKRLQYLLGDSSLVTTEVYATYKKSK